MGGEGQKHGFRKYFSFRITVSF